MATRSPWLDSVRATLWAQERFGFIPDRVLEPPTGECERGGGARVAFTGFPSDYSLAFLLALLELDVDVVAIVTSPRAHPVIRGRNALSQVADHAGIPLLRLERVNDDDGRARLEALGLDGLVMASFDQIVKADALAIPRHGWLNVHPSALPLYRGPEPVYWAIADGAAEAGITLHRAVPRFDAGPVLARRLVTIAPDEDAGTLTRRLCAAGAAALGEAVGRLLADDPGDPLDLSAATYRPSVGHRLLEAATSAAEAERMVRAGHPNIPAYTHAGGRMFFDRGANPPRGRRAELDGLTPHARARARALFVHRAAVIDEGCGEDDLRYADGCLRILEASPVCECAGAAGAPGRCPNLEIQL